MPNIIKIPDAVKYYRGTPGQVAAWEYLEQAISDQTRLQFQQLYRQQAKPPILPTPSTIYMHAFLAGGWDDRDLRVIALTLMNGDKAVDRVSVCSGQSYAQDLVHPTIDYSGSMRICPEGVYDLGKIDDIGYAPGPHDGFGRYVIPIFQRNQPGESSPPNNRSALLIHSDNNRARAPGSAGCLCPYNSYDMAKIVAWMRSQAKPQYLLVDLGRGYLQSFTDVYQPKRS